MFDTQKLIIQFLLLLSAGFFVYAIICFKRQLTKNKWKSLNQRLFKPTCLLFLSIFSLRCILGLNEVASLGSGALIKFPYIFLNGLIRTMQTFSLDENYLESISIVKNLFIDEYNWQLLPDIYVVFASILNLCAPIVGGAIILGILTSIFPRLRLLIRPFKEKYVFSELNEKAVYLAESIYKNKKGSLIIFTDAYIDQSSEIITELFQRVNNIGAICIKDDILKITFLSTKILNYILIDQDEKNNLSELITLVTEDEKRWKNECNIFVFSRNPEIGSIIDKLNRDNIAKASNITIKPIQEYTNIAYHLIGDMPLYYPLLGKYPTGYTGEKELNLTILGGGKIGTEVFLGAYWCAQMLNCKLRINVVTKKVKKFEAKINSINPEILLSGKEKHELLKVFPEQEKYAEPYASFLFQKADARSDRLIDVLKKMDLLSSDYFVISLGSDKLNMNTAAKIDREIRREALKKKASPTGYRPVIAYAIYDPKTNAVLKNDSQSKYSYCCTFASLQDIYSYDNIFMGGLGGIAYEVNKKHTTTDDKVTFKKSEYKYWSSIGRVLHLKYKMYSIGAIKDNGMKYENEKSDYLESIKNESINKELSWLEHRRWNAFMRAKGYIAPTESQFENYAFKEANDHKNISLKLHPCIVESSNDSKIENDDWDNSNHNENNKLDCLDSLDIKIYNMKAIKNDFKQWDKPDVDL